MFFVPVTWEGYEFACLTPSGRAALGVTDTKQVRLLAREADGRSWQVLREWPMDQLSHTNIISHLGGHEEPATPDDLLLLLIPLEGPPDSGAKTRTPGKP